MKYSILLLTIFFVVLFSDCEKGTIDINSDWKYTEYKYLIMDSNIFEMNTRAKFVRVSDSILLFYGYNQWTQSDCFYKLMFDNDNVNIKNLKPLIYGTPSDVKDISFPNNSTGFLLINDREANTGIDSKLFQSSDGGEIWNEKILNFRNTFRWIHFITPDSGIAISENYIGISHDIYTTSDGGNNWQKIINEYFIEDHALSDFYFIPKNPKICFVSSFGQLFYSTNGGFNWRLHSTHEADIVSMSFLNENVGFIANSNVTQVGSTCNSANTIYKIDQIGGSYMKMYSGDNDMRKIEAINENEVYFSQWFLSTVFCTSDGFRTVKRTTIQDPLPNVAGDRLVVDFTLFSRLGILSDVKGTLYLKNN